MLMSINTGQCGLDITTIPACSYTQKIQPTGFCSNLISVPYLTAMHVSEVIGNSLQDEYNRFYINKQINKLINKHTYKIKCVAYIDEKKYLSQPLVDTQSFPDHHE